MQIILFIKINMAINEKSYSDLPQMRNQPQESWRRSCRVLNNLCFCSLCPRDAAAALMGRPFLFFWSSSNCLEYKFWQNQRSAAQRRTAAVSKLVLHRAPAKRARFTQNQLCMDTPQRGILSILVIIFYILMLLKLLILTIRYIWL